MFAPLRPLTFRPLRRRADVIGGATRRQAARFAGVRPGSPGELRLERRPWHGVAAPGLVLSRRGMWALAGRALAPWAAGPAARLLPPCSRHAAAVEPRATRRPFSTAELKVTGSPRGRRWGFRVCSEGGRALPPWLLARLA